MCYLTGGQGKGSDWRKGLSQKGVSEGMDRIKRNEAKNPTIKFKEADIVRNGKKTYKF